jgi:hypothetical protein
MQHLLRVLAVALFVAVWPSQSLAQVEQESIISIYRIAPGQHVAFLQWMADREASSQQAGVPASQWYVHHNGDSWDYLVIAADLTDEQAAASDAADQAAGLKIGAAAGVELRQYVAWHTDTFAGGPMTASELLAAAQE